MNKVTARCWRCGRIETFMMLGSDMPEGARCKVCYGEYGSYGRSTLSVVSVQPNAMSDDEVIGHALHGRYKPTAERPQVRVPNLDAGLTAEEIAEREQLMQLHTSRLYGRTRSTERLFKYDLCLHIEP